MNRLRADSCYCNNTSQYATYPQRKSQHSTYPNTALVQTTNAGIPKVWLYIAIALSCPLIGSLSSSTHIEPDFGTLFLQRLLHTIFSSDVCGRNKVSEIGVGLRGVNKIMKISFPTLFPNRRWKHNQKRGRDSIACLANTVVRGRGG